MSKFIDPRTNPAPELTKRAPRMTSDMTALEDLAALCRDGRLYDVEQWIQTGRPLQLSGRVTTRPRKWNSALRIAIKQQNHSLVFLLLCNGYDSDLEPESPLDL